jgi:hypothetical protein
MKGTILVKYPTLGRVYNLLQNTTILFSSVSNRALEAEEGPGGKSSRDGGGMHRSCSFSRATGNSAVAAGKPVA